MTDKPSIDGLTFTRDCYGQPVRIFMWEDCPWFEASALCAAIGIDPANIDLFDRTALDTDIALFPFDAEPVPVFSPIGHFKFVQSHGTERDAKFAAWSRREAAELVPNPAADDPRFRLTLGQDGSRPAYPSRYTGRLGEWKALKYLPGYKSDNAILREKHFIDLKALAATQRYKAPAASVVPTISSI